MESSLSTSLLIGGASGQHVSQLGRMSNRHGLITGATGTGKTITLQILAEGFSRMGVPVFAADIKGDLSGIARAGKPHRKVQERIDSIGIDNFEFAASTVVFWDLFGKTGVPIRMTISEMGPLLLSSLMALNETQTGVMYAVFRIADDNGLLLLDLKDLRTMLVWVAENAKTLKLEYGNISGASIGAIQRRLLTLEEQGADKVFGEPALDIKDLMTLDSDGNGIINILDATKLVAEAPDLYACFLFWLLSELFEELPEQGDTDIPKFVLFFDEAHLLFSQAPKSLLDKVEQVVRLIRSKGVGVYFVTQSPLDIPESVLGQLGLKIQHALRAFTPKDRRALKLIAESFRPNPNFDTEQVITDLGTGEALVSVLEEKGNPSPVERTLVCPPTSQIGPINEALRNQIVASSDALGRYSVANDRESAYEKLKARAETKETRVEKGAKSKPKAVLKARSKRQSIGEAMAKSVARAIGSNIGRQLVRGIMGSLFGKGR
ncbi:MAG: DNA helicase HerA-like ATPase [Gammaproteobacteria bacterium]|jgi:DNA helicase HerA-like ATPase